jgi:hypothetical protein
MVIQLLGRVWWLIKQTTIILVFSFLLVSITISPLVCFSCHTEDLKENLVVTKGVPIQSKSSFADGKSTPIAFQVIQPQWSHTFGGSHDEYSTGFVECSSGGYAIAGTTQSFGNGARDAWLIRTDASGSHMWNRTFGGTEDDYGYDVIECSGGGFLVAGKTKSFDGGRESAWLIRTDADGNLIWSRTYVGTEGFRLLEYSGGGFVVAGSYGSDGWLLRTDNSGIAIWNRTYGGTEWDQIHGLVENTDGGFALSGQTRSYGAGQYDLWLVITNSIGSILENRVSGGTDGDYGVSIVECTGGGYAISGRTTSFGAGSLDAWLVRTDSSGSRVWDQTYGGAAEERGSDLVECEQGGFAIAGYTESLGAGDWDMWLIRTDNMGNEVWNYTFGGPDRDYAFSVLECDDDGFVLSGATMSYGAGDYDVWLVRVAPDTSSPEWVVAPTNQEIWINNPFHYNLDAIDPSNLDVWWINDTMHFSISTAGVITNATSLGLGEYGVRVSVNDTWGNVLTDSFTVSVSQAPPTTPTTTPTPSTPIPGFPPQGIVIGILVGILISVIIRRRKQS